MYSQKIRSGQHSLAIPGLGSRLKIVSDKVLGSSKPSFATALSGPKASALSRPA